MTATLRVFLVDDEPPALNRLQDILADCRAEFPHEVVGTAQNGPEAIEKLVQQPADLVLTDINMPGMNGLELARHLGRLHHRPAVIFCTAFDEFAVQAFEVHALDYLLKPIRQERLAAALARARELPHASTDALASLATTARRYFSVAERGRVRLVPVDSVLFLKAELKYVTLKTREAEFLLEESLTQLEAEFGDRFLRIHRNCLIARNKLQGFERGHEEGEGHWMAILDGCAEKLPVSRRQAHVVREFRRGDA
ncbi:LytTR family DNA-binding domain-containing protein [Chitinimonas viridis]|uniref:LytTR family DNA-binding domain-containing protein n=2 Tax=Chitinimonas TaxID=240411 RepID=A0ABT8BAI4_9NEIS|nr:MULTISPECIES: LytTR family DNA-binding domain-containing protein [Chitinimonas]MBL8507802.1 response regulator transcription factor [Chitinimonas sp.]MDN3578489.1 LytTR family DNA-binding domain-containing protein [Chitinimonas viridis]GLR12369.1 DNA-binding response regulator [Chitinimonas prasina]